MNRVVMMCLSAAVLFSVGGCGGQERMGVKKVRFASAPDGVFKVMTFNIRVDTILDGLNGWGNRKSMVADALADNAADVIGLQEALAHQLTDIREALPQYDVYAVGREDGAQKGETCAILFRHDRFGLLESGTFWFSDTPEEPGSKDWGNLWPRLCSWVHIFELETGFSFYVYNVHLSVLSQNSRSKSAQLLAQRIADRRVPDPFIVTGDFNMSLDNPAMQYLANAGERTPYPRMFDAWTSANRSRLSAGTKHGFKGLSGPRIDHIPVSEEGQALNAMIDKRKVNGRYPSDHYPVVAEIQFNNIPSGLRAAF